MKNYALQLHGNPLKLSAVKSTLAAETQALETCFIMKCFLCEMLNKEISNEVLPIKCYVNNKSLKDSIFSTKTLTEKSPTCEEGEAYVKISFWHLLMNLKN